MYVRLQLLLGRYKAILSYAVQGIYGAAHILILLSTPQFSGLSFLSRSSDLVYKSLERFRVTTTDFALTAQNSITDSSALMDLTRE